MSLVSRLSLVILVPFLVLYAAYTLLELARSREAARTQFHQYAASLADITAQSTSAIVWNLDYPTLLGATASLSREPMVLGVLYTFHASETTTPDDAFLVVGTMPERPEIISEHENLAGLEPEPDSYSLLLTREITLHGRSLGTAYFYFVDTEIEARLAGDAKNLIGLALLFIASYLVTVFLMLTHYFTRPFQKVHGLALAFSDTFNAIKNRFEAGKDLDPNMLPDAEALLAESQIDKVRKDEVGDFTRSFVTMVNTFSILLAQLSEHARVIREMNESLEERINVRTCELKSSNEALSSSLKALKQTQASLVQQEKLASIGQLAAGVAHEVNNPIGYIGSNINRLREYFVDIKYLIEHIEQQIIDPLSEEQRQIARQQLATLKEELDYEFLMEDLPELLNDCNEGSDRVRDIVQNLKDYSRSDTSTEKTDSDVNNLITRTLRLVWNELKYNCEVDFEAGEMPLVPVHSGQVSQVISNLLINAGQAIKTTGKKGRIVIKTWADNKDAWIRVSDTGCGIKPENLGKVFDPFFTTKPVGEGTGLGMNISYDIVVNKHHGALDVESVPGKGTEFTVRLPLRQAPDLEATG